MYIRAYTRIYIHTQTHSGSISEDSDLVGTGWRLKHNFKKPYRQFSFAFPVEIHCSLHEGKGKK